MKDAHFDPHRLQLSPGLKRLPSRSRTNSSRRGSDKRFLKGPIPLGWLTAAAKQPGKALHVAIALWFLSGMKRSRKVLMPLAELSAFGVSRFAAYRGLGALEKAELVSVARHQGRKSVVTILN